MYTVTLYEIFYEICQFNSLIINVVYPVASKPLGSNILFHFRQFPNFPIFHLVGYVQNDRGSFDRNSLDRNCVFSVDRKFHNQLIKFFETFQLIEKFDQVPKNNLRILAVDRKY